MEPPPTLQQDKSTTWILVIVAVVVAGGLAWWLWPQRAGSAPAAVETTAAPASDATQIPAPASTEPAPSADAGDTDPWATAISELPDFSWPPQRAEASAARQALIAELAPLDSEPGGRGLYERLSATAVELAANPPLTGENRDPEVLWSNVLHLSRVLGKRRTMELASLLSSPGADSEALAAASYTWLLTRAAAKDPVERTINLEQLYAYASWLLDSVGGRALLARRLPKYEALAEFYALLTVDLARRENLSSRGTDPRPHFARCRQLIETQQLAHRQAYLTALDQVESRW